MLLFSLLLSVKLVSSAPTTTSPPSSTQRATLQTLPSSHTPPTTTSDVSAPNELVVTVPLTSSAISTIGQQQPYATISPTQPNWQLKYVTAVPTSPPTLVAGLSTDTSTNTTPKLSVIVTLEVWLLALSIGWIVLTIVVVSIIVWLCAVGRTRPKISKENFARLYETLPQIPPTIPTALNPILENYHNHTSTQTRSRPSSSPVSSATYESIRSSRASTPPPTPVETVQQTRFGCPFPPTPFQAYRLLTQPHNVQLPPPPPHQRQRQQQQQQQQQPQQPPPPQQQQQPQQQHHQQQQQQQQQQQLRHVQCGRDRRGLPKCLPPSNPIPQQSNRTQCTGSKRAQSNNQHDYEYLDWDEACTTTNATGGGNQDCSGCSC